MFSSLFLRLWKKTTTGNKQNGKIGTCGSNSAPCHWLRPKERIFYQNEKRGLSNRKEDLWLLQSTHVICGTTMWSHSICPQLRVNILWGWPPCFFSTENYGHVSEWFVRERDVRAFGACLFSCYSTWKCISQSPPTLERLKIWMLLNVPFQKSIHSRNCDLAHIKSK